MIIDAYTTPGTERETELSAADLLRQMDHAGVARAVIAPEDRELAVHGREGNRRMLQLARQFPERLIPACTANPWHADCQLIAGEAIAAGARILVLAPALQGFMPADELAGPLLTLAGERGVPVYIHTGPHASGSPAQWVGPARRWPTTRFILGHGGSTDHGWDMGSLLSHHLLPNLWFETSLMRPWALPAHQAAAGDRWLFGSSLPRHDLAYELSCLQAQLPLADNPGLYGGNLARLLASGG